MQQPLRILSSSYESALTRAFAVPTTQQLVRRQVSLPKGSSQSSSLGALLLGCGQTPECLCYFFVKHEKLQSKTGDVASFENAAAVDTVKEGGDIVPWPALRIHALDTLGVMCEVSDSAIQTVVASQAIPLLLSVLRCVREWFNSAATYVDVVTSTSSSARCFLDVVAWAKTPYVRFCAWLLHCYCR